MNSFTSENSPARCMPMAIAVTTATLWKGKAGFCTANIQLLRPYLSTADSKPRSKSTLFHHGGKARGRYSAMYNICVCMRKEETIEQRKRKKRKREEDRKMEREM